MALPKKPSICIVAGESSGDILGGRLATLIRQQQPNCRLIGVGGTEMKNAGVDIIMDCYQLAVMGVFEILLKFNILRRCMNTLVNLFKIDPPDLLILIDYPGFNLRLAARAKEQGIKVMYYVSPQIWAWHYSRIERIRQNVDKMAVLFPFEKKIYEKEGVPVEFVGHPLVETIKPSLSREQAFQQFNLDSQKMTIGLLPGSRAHEIQRLLPDILAAAKLLRAQFPAAQFLLALAPHLTESFMSRYDLDGITVIQHNTHNAIQLCQIAIVASGTVTLEVGLLKVPMVIVYRVNALTALIGRFITEIAKMARGEKCFGLCNIVAEEALMPELLQSRVTPKAIYHAAYDLLENQSRRDYIQHKLSLLAEKLQSVNASEKAAFIALQLLNSA